jgi:hypothetical protein
MLLMTIRLFENRVLKKIFEPKKDEVTSEWKKNYKMRSMMICTIHPLSSGW